MDCNYLIGIRPTFDSSSSVTVVVLILAPNYLADRRRIQQMASNVELEYCLLNYLERVLAHAAGHA